MIRIGSRGSQLALWQANYVADELRRLGAQVTIEIIRTAGDRMQEIPVAPAENGKGIFTREIEDALLQNRIDLAVHSLKDLPTELSPLLSLAAIPKREDPRDVLVSRKYGCLDELPVGAAIGTGSLRRQAQLLHIRPDLHCIEFRGNVDTRLNKLAQGKADAIILAAAGLDRLQRTEWVRQRFSPEVLCPAPGQGALAIECRRDDARLHAALAPLDDRATRLAVTAERAFLAALGGGCEVPIGGYCRILNTPTDKPTADPAPQEFSLQGVVASAEGKTIMRAEVRHVDPMEAADQLARRLLAEGAAGVLGLRTAGV